MMSEQMPYSMDVIKRVSGDWRKREGHDDGFTLPTDIAESIVTTKHLMDGLSWTRFIGMAYFDMLMHSSAPPYAYNGKDDLSLSELFDEVQEHISGE